MPKADMSKLRDSVEAVLEASAMTNEPLKVSQVVKEYQKRCPRENILSAKVRDGLDFLSYHDVLPYCKKYWLIQTENGYLIEENSKIKAIVLADQKIDLLSNDESRIWHDIPALLALKELPVKKRKDIQNRIIGTLKGLGYIFAMGVQATDLLTNDIYEKTLKRYEFNNFDFIGVVGDKKEFVRPADERSETYRDLFRIKLAGDSCRWIEGVFAGFEYSMALMDAAILLHLALAEEPHAWESYSSAHGYVVARDHIYGPIYGEKAGEFNEYIRLLLLDHSALYQGFTGSGTYQSFDRIMNRFRGYGEKDEKRQQILKGFLILALASSTRLPTTLTHREGDGLDTDLFNYYKDAYEKMESALTNKETRIMKPDNMEEYVLKRINKIVRRSNSGSPTHDNTFQEAFGCVTDTQIQGRMKRKVEEALSEDLAFNNSGFMGDSIKGSYALLYFMSEVFLKCKDHKASFRLLSFDRYQIPDMDKPFSSVLNDLHSKILKVLEEASKDKNANNYLDHYFEKQTEKLMADALEIAGIRFFSERNIQPNIQLVSVSPGLKHKLEKHMPVLKESEDSAKKLIDQIMSEHAEGKSLALAISDVLIVSRLMSVDEARKGRELREVYTPYVTQILEAIGKLDPTHTRRVKLEFEIPQQNKVVRREVCIPKELEGKEIDGKTDSTLIENRKRCYSHYLATYVTNLGVSIGYQKLGITIGTDSEAQDVYNLIPGKFDKLNLNKWQRYIENYFFDILAIQNSSADPPEKADSQSYNRRNQKQTEMSKKDDIDAFDPINDPQGLVFVGVDVGGTSTKVSLMVDGEIQHSDTIETRNSADKRYGQYTEPEEFLDKILNAINGLVDPLVDKKLYYIDGIGISWAGAVRDREIAAPSGALTIFHGVDPNSKQQIRDLELAGRIKKVALERMEDKLVSDLRKNPDTERKELEDFIDKRLGSLESQRFMNIQDEPDETARRFCKIISDRFTTTIVNDGDAEAFARVCQTLRKPLATIMRTSDGRPKVNKFVKSMRKQLYEKKIEMGEKIDPPEISGEKWEIHDEDNDEHYIVVSKDGNWDVYPSPDKNWIVLKLGTSLAGAHIQGTKVLPHIAEDSKVILNLQPDPKTIDKKDISGLMKNSILLHF